MGEEVPPSRPSPGGRRKTLYLGERKGVYFGGEFFITFENNVY